MEATNQLQTLLRKWKKEILTKWENLRNIVDIIDNDEVDVERVQILSDLCQNGGADLKYLEEERGFALIPHVFWSARLIQFFINQGINVNSQDDNGDTALHLALRHLRDPNRNDTILSRLKRVPKIVKFFLVKLSTVDPNVPNSRGETPLFTLSRELIRYPDANKHIVKIAEMLVKRGASVETSNVHGESMLHRKYDRNRFYIFDHDEYHMSNENRNRIHKNVCIPCHFVKRFKETNAVEVRTPSWLYSPLMFAADEYRLQCCRLLVETLGADLNATDFQGYTALHHAAAVQLNFHLRTEILIDPAKLLIDLGTDPDKKSTMGRDVYELAILGSSIAFTYGAKPVTKKIKILELAGAIKMYSYDSHNPLRALPVKHLWHEAMDLCQEFNLQASEEFKRNFELLAEYPFIDGLHPFYGEESFNQLLLTCLNTVVRLSEGPKLKFWNGLCYSVSHSKDCFKCLDYLLSNDNFIQLCPEDLASVEELDFKSLLDLSEFFRNRIHYFIKLNEPKQMADRISLFHFFATLSVACFNKLIAETNCNSKRLPCFTRIQAYVSICHTLAVIRSNFGDIISEDAFNENARLLKTMVDLDLRDQDGNSLLHLTLISSNGGYRWHSKCIIQILDVFLDFVDVRATNLKGFQPSQCINWHDNSELWWYVSGLRKSTKFDQQTILNVIIKMADRGAHIDFKNAFEGPTLRYVFEITENHYPSFHYDTLKCMCARVLIRSVVPFRKMAPKPIVDFILAHGNDPVIYDFFFW